MQNVFETERLFIRRATVSERDVDMYYRLWNHPEVMVNVGFPNGLGISREKIVTQFDNQDNTVFRSRLMAHLKDSGTPIGECMLALPDDMGVSETDVKLFPEFWNQGYGTEIKQGLVNYLFTHVPECMAVKADPAKTNIRSQRMQEKVGAVRIERGRDYPIAGVEKYIPETDHYLYMVFRVSRET